jgi:hypothetical protein
LLGQNKESFNRKKSKQNQCHYLIGDNICKQMIVYGNSFKVALFWLDYKVEVLSTTFLIVSLWKGENVSHHLLIYY